MHFYIKENSNSFVSVDLDKKLYSTINSYPERFFDNLSNNTYSFFPFDSSVLDANSDFILFHIFNQDEKYIYLGEANSTEELLFLLNKEAVVFVNFSEEGFLCCTRRNSHEFCFPGGKIDFNESPLNAVIREVKEETNINIFPSDLTLLKTYSIFGYKAYVFVSFISNLSPSINEPGIVPFFTSKEYLISNNAAFKDFNIQFFNDFDYLFKL